jgi:hypothetical protein
MTAPKVLIGGDWNEPPMAEGRYSADWICDMTGCVITHGTPGNMGRIDFVVSDAPISDMTLNGTGGSDHNLRTFKAWKNRIGSGPFLRGAIWNAERDRDPKDVVAFLRAVLMVDHTDFVLLQECQQYHQALNGIPGYRLFALPGRGINQNVILVRDGVAATGFRVKRMSRWTWRTSGGVEHASPYMPHVCLDGWLRVSSVHCMSQIDWRGGRMVGPLDRRRIRAQEARRLVRWVGHVRAGLYDRK